MDIPLTHLWLSLVAGSLTTLSPCFFPILPLVIGGAVQTNRLAPMAMGTCIATSIALISIVLGLFGIGAAIPLVAVAYASRQGFNTARGWVLQRIDGIKKAFGVIILLTGIAILSGADKWLEVLVASVLPDAWVQATTLF